MFAYSVAAGSEFDGFGVVTDRFLCLLGPEATLEVARDTYRLLDDESADLTEVLTVLTAQHGLVRFAVVELLDPVSRNFAIAVRGKVALELEQTSATRLSGASDDAWISTEARGVNTLRLMLESDVPPGDQQLPIRRGVVATSFLSLDNPTADPQGLTANDEPVNDEIDVKTVPVTRPAMAKAEPAAERAEPAAKAVKPTLKKSRSKAVAIDKPPVKEVDEDTVIGPNGSGEAWVLTLPDGSEVSVGLPIVVGRRPWSVEPKDRKVVHVVAPASQHEISGTHLELFLDEGGVQARDLNSTNGTVVRTPSRPPRLLHAGGTTTLVAGDILDIGEDFSIALSARV